MIVFMRGYKSGNIYAEFVTVVERNQAQFNTEDRSKQYDWGEGREKVFLVVICQGTGHDICINPEKELYPRAIDLYEYTLKKRQTSKHRTHRFLRPGNTPIKISMTKDGESV